ncbi:F-box domain-containing protein [Mycena chlorophos]|uniref:F-box domain-containing protein n=1 Tax=Mycena chlorophos TaxID=658473 RepID=A0A8H6VUD7_MYCCL|nr:F-box domain-containing protein [Mycena chlorophos]
MSPLESASTRAEIFRVEAEIALHTAAIKTLHERLVPLRSQLQTIVDRTCAIQRLPVELLSEIFILSLPEELTMLGEMRDTPLTPATQTQRLAVVCSRWRTVALRIQPLWTEFALSLSPCIVSATEKLRVTADRAGVRPLTVKISGSSLDECEPLQWSTFMSAFRTIAPRTKALYLGLDTCDMAIMDRDAESLHFVVLETLVLFAEDRGAEAGKEIRMFAHAPRLHGAMLTTISPLAVQLPWAQLTRLRVENYFLPDAHDILRRAANITWAHISLTPHDREFFLPLTTTHMHLEYLRLNECYGSVDGPHVLEHLVCPALRYLRLYSEDADTEYFAHEDEEPIHLPEGKFFTFIQRSPNLKSLELDTIWNSQSPLPLQPLPITHLKINAVLSEAAASRIVGSLENWCLAKLTHLELCVAENQLGATGSSLRTVAQAAGKAIVRRNRAYSLNPSRPHAIQSLRLVARGYADAVHSPIAELAALEQSGVNVFVGGVEKKRTDPVRL